MACSCTCMAQFNAQEPMHEEKYLRELKFPTVNCVAAERLLDAEKLVVFRNAVYGGKF